jgi:hypothetical protein
MISLQLRKMAANAASDDRERQSEVSSFTKPDAQIVIANSFDNESNRRITSISSNDATSRARFENYAW